MENESKWLMLRDDQFEEVPIELPPQNPIFEQWDQSIIDWFGVTNVLWIPDGLAGDGLPVSQPACRLGDAGHPVEC